MSEEQVPIQENKQEQVPTKKKFYQKTWGKVLIGIVVVIGGLVIFTMQATSAAVKVSNQFLNAMQAGDGATAYSLFSSEAKDSVDSDEFETVVDQVGPILNTKEKIVERSIEAETGESSKATIVYDIKGTDDKNYKVAVELTKEDGNWKVLNFDSDEDN
ncbi:MAG: DUF4878 domain-containing protein [Candidatus Saccharibacteria bacterium]|nr:DUF4878 domain-containing protein [Candidatus Saccharibacteria bacterium]